MDCWDYHAAFDEDEGIAFAVGLPILPFLGESLAARVALKLAVRGIDRF